MNTYLFFCELAACCFFILGIRYLASPRTAVRGNLLAVIGMGLVSVAVFPTLSAQTVWKLIGVLALGGGLGIFGGLKVRMTDLPQMIAALNGLGGLASVLIGLAELRAESLHLTEISVGMSVGAAAFGGSVVAFLKLQGIWRSGFGRFRFQNYLNVLLAVFGLGAWYAFAVRADLDTACLLIASVSILAFAVTFPVGGADMPIMISLLNACSGWAAAAIGFSLNNVALIITGALVGSAGTILSFVMTQAMNRPLKKVLFDYGTIARTQDLKDDRTVRVGSAAEAAFILENSSKLIIVPGYGMAAAQAQYALQAMAEVLRQNYQVEVKFAIHPVAGRMPGHMNVLLAEAHVPYEDLYTLEEINREFEYADAVYVIGANDITNPLAATDVSSPIYGMPVLDVGKAKTVFFVKRSLGVGYAGVENPLFYDEHTVMLYGDARKVTEEIVRVLEKKP